MNPDVQQNAARVLSTLETPPASVSVILVKPTSLSHTQPYKACRSTQLFDGNSQPYEADGSNVAHTAAGHELA